MPQKIAKTEGSLGEMMCNNSITCSLIRLTPRYVRLWEKVSKEVGYKIENKIRYNVPTVSENELMKGIRSDLYLSQKLKEKG